MSGRSWKFLETVYSKVFKSNSQLTNAFEKNLLQIQNIANKKYETIVKQVNGVTIIPDFKLNEVDNKPIEIPRQLINWWKWYQHLTGLNDVELARQKMLFIQEKLFTCQDRRRTLNNEMTLISEKLKDIYGELIQTKREDQKYVQLTIMENKSLQEQNRIMSQLNLIENEARDYFTQLSTAIKEYHDSQNLNAQKYKYLSILASALIAIISLIGTTIYNNKRIADVHKIIEQGQNEAKLLFQSHFESFKQTVLNDINDNYDKIDNKLVNYEPTPNVINESVNNEYLSENSKIILGTVIIFFIFNKLLS